MNNSEAALIGEAVMSLDASREALDEHYERFLNNPSAVSSAKLVRLLELYQEVYTEERRLRNACSKRFRESIKANT